MAKRDASVKRTSPTTDTTTTPGTTAGGDPMEARVLAFAEQLGRIVGTVQARTEGWMDRDALNKQIASVRDGATELLEQMKAGVAQVTGSEKKAASPAARAKAPAKNRGRSGGVVDAPGKKHRQPTPVDPRARTAAAKTSTIRAGKASMKTMKQRGRG